MNLKSLLIAIGVLAVVLLVSNVLYVVHETERAILLRFGAVSKPDIASGLGIKWPIAEEVKKFDGRVLTVDARVETYYTLEQKPLRVDSFAKWRIGDVERFYTSTAGDEQRANELLQERVNEGLRNQISRRDMHEVISGERDQLMDELTTSLNEVMSAEMGVRVIDVRVKRIDLPTDVEDAVYERMNSAREIEAKQYRASGEEQSIGIKADADRQVTVINADAYRIAQELRGAGDAQAAKIYADAFNKDPEFYAFYRRVTAYANVFSQKNDQLVLDMNADFFKYLNAGPSGR